jgi:thioredoxin reductase
MTKASEQRDVVIVGGGPAGLSAALVLGRARQRVLVVDADRPANAVSRSIGGLLAFTRSPAALRRAGRRQLRELPNVEVADAIVLDVQPDGDGVTVAVARDDGVETVRARAVLLAQGLRYEAPKIPGLGELWGRSVFHCAFCDGHEVAGRPLAVRATGPGAARQARLLSAWSDDVLLVTDGQGVLADGEREELEAVGIRVREERIARVESRRRRLTRIVFVDGPAEQREALFVAADRAQPSLLHERAGGDAAATVRSVAIAIGNGARVATAMAADLIVDRLAEPASAARA